MRPMAVSWERAFKLYFVLNTHTHTHTHTHRNIITIDTTYIQPQNMTQAADVLLIHIDVALGIC